MSYQNLSPNEINDFQNNDSRYQEYTMSDVVAKKSKKKLIITLIVIAAVIALGVASFFIIRSIIGGNSVKEIQQDPTKYVFQSYLATADKLSDEYAVLKPFVGLTSNQETIKSTVTSNGFSQTTKYSVDVPAKKFYAFTEQSYNISQEMKKYYSGPEKITAELYTDMQKAVAKVQMDNDKFDYYVKLDNLREDAVTSMFGPKGENVFKIDQKTYDTVMDVYEFIYNNLAKNSDPFSIELLASKLKGDFEKACSVDVAQEKVEIDGAQTDAYVISHTFNSTEIITSVLTDVKDWVKDVVNINDEINAALDQALSKMDVSQLVSQINASAKDFELVLKHYVNKDNALMQAEIVANVNGQGFKVSLTFGADPASSKKVVLKVSTVGSSSESVLQSITLANESTAAEEKIVATYSGMLISGNTTYTRNTSSGDFTLTNNMSSPMSAMGGQGAIVPSQADSMMNMSCSGNIQMTDDSITITTTQPSYDGSDVKMEYYVSSKAEITELTSKNNLLTAKSSEIQKVLFPKEAFGSTF